MKQFEYKLVIEKLSLNELNDLGKDGWELCDKHFIIKHSAQEMDGVYRGRQFFDIESKIDGIHYTFKREIVSEKCIKKPDKITFS